MQIVSCCRLCRADKRNAFLDTPNQQLHRANKGSHPLWVRSLFFYGLPQGKLPG